MKGKQWVCVDVWENPYVFWCFCWRTLCQNNECSLGQTGWGIRNSRWSCKNIPSRVVFLLRRDKYVFFFPGSNNKVMVIFRNIFMATAHASLGDIYIEITKMFVKLLEYSCTNIWRRNFNWFSKLQIVICYRLHVIIPFNCCWKKWFLIYRTTELHYTIRHYKCFCAYR